MDLRKLTSTAARSVDLEFNILPESSPQRWVEAVEHQTRDKGSWRGRQNEGRHQPRAPHCFNPLGNPQTISDRMSFRFRRLEEIALINSNIAMNSVADQRSMSICSEVLLEWEPTISCDLLNRHSSSRGSLRRVSRTDIPWEYCRPL